MREGLGEVAGQAPPFGVVLLAQQADVVLKRPELIEVELTDQRACLGRLYFPVPGWIQYGQHWLNVKFAKSLVRVPFRILTEEEGKYLEKNFRDIKKQVDKAFRKK
jgi:hypothetical protein